MSGVGLADPPSPLALAAALRGRTILVCDDQPDMVWLVTAILEECGVRVLSAGSGSEGLALAQAHGLDALVTDIVMPGLSGPELARAVQKIHPGLPIVYMSGYCDASLLPRGAAPGAFVPKPFEIERLVSAIAGALSVGVALTAQ